MTTARDLIVMASKEAGILGVGQTQLDGDVNDCYTLMIRMLDQWQKRRWLVPGLTDISAVGNDKKFNPIGPGQYYNAIRPDKIQSAYFIQTIAQSGSPVSYPLRQVFSYEDYARITLKELNSFPGWFFYDAHYPNGNVYVWPIPSASYLIHLITKLPIGVSTSLANGVIKSAGVGYVDGSYISVPLISDPVLGSLDATLDITVAGGIVSSVMVNSNGNGYSIGQELTVDNVNLGGTGSDFVFTVTQTSGSLDNELTMPPEYEEAIHYNLALRICSLYGVDPKQSTGGLAKVALNTIKNANAQVPSLRIPGQYNGARGGFNIYAPDVYNNG